MASPPATRRRTTRNPYLDLEATVEREEEFVDAEEVGEGNFINDDSEEDVEENQCEGVIDQLHTVRYSHSAPLSSDEQEEPHAALLHQFIQLDLGRNTITAIDTFLNDEPDNTLTQNPYVRRPAWAEIAYVNSTVAAALDTWDIDSMDRRIGNEDKLYEVSCEAGKEETIAFRILHNAMQINTSGPRDICIPLAKSAIANPFLPGRVYIESTDFASVVCLARCVRGLNPSSVRPVPKELLSRALMIQTPPIPDYTFVRLIRPSGLSNLTCMVAQNCLLIVPTYLKQNPDDIRGGSYNFDNILQASLPPDSRNAPPAPEIHPHENENCHIWHDQWGFRYIQLRHTSQFVLEPYEPSVTEVELLFKYGRIADKDYKRFMACIEAYSLRPSDRVIFKTGEYARLVGTIIDAGTDDSCSVYVPSQGILIRAGRRELRRHFRLGDLVSATADDVVLRLGSRTGWVVGESVGYQTGFSNVEDIDPVSGLPKAPIGYKSDLRVYSPESDREIYAAHYEFEFVDEPNVSLHPATVPVPISEITIGSPYTLTANTGYQAQSFFGLVRAIEGINIPQIGTNENDELSAGITFSIWNKDSDAPFGYLPEWEARNPIDRLYFTDYGITVGDTVILKDEEGRGGTARVTWLGHRDVHLCNLTGSLKVSLSHVVRSTGAYDVHIGKTVRIIRGPWKGCIGVIKSANAIGLCTVELTVFPIKVISISITLLVAVDESAIFIGLLPALTEPILRAITPQPEGSSSMDEDFPTAPGLDCRWLTDVFVNGIPIKLVSAKRPMRRPYHFLCAFTDYALDSPRMMLRVLDRQKERIFGLDDLHWLPASEINQTVINITGENGGTLFWTIRLEGDECEVRKVPSKRRAPSVVISRLQLAQVNAKRT